MTTSVSYLTESIAAIIHESALKLVQSWFLGARFCQLHLPEQLSGLNLKPLRSGQLQLDSGGEPFQSHFDHVCIPLAFLIAWGGGCEDDLAKAFSPVSTSRSGGYSAMAVDLDVAKLEQELQGIYQERQAVRNWHQKRPDNAA